MSQNTTDNIVIMGTVVNAFGILGFIKIKTDSQDSSISLSRYKNLHLQIAGKWLSYKVIRSQTHDNMLNIKLSGIDDRNAALKLKGSSVGVLRSEFPQITDPNEYYWVDLIGLTVLNHDALILGHVTNLIDSGANCILVVDGEVRHLIPFVAAYITNVNLDKQEIIVDWGSDY